MTGFLGGTKNLGLSKAVEEGITQSPKALAAAASKAGF